MLHGLFFPEGRTVLAPGARPGSRRKDSAFALEAGTRTGACVLVLLLFSFTVSAPDLVAALAARGLPPQFGFVLASALTLLPAMAGRLEADQGGAGGPRTGGPAAGVVSRLVAVRLQMVPLVLGLIEDAGSRAQALDARGFGSPGPHHQLPRGCRTRPPSAGFRAVLLVLAAAAVVLRLVASWPAPGLPWQPGSHDKPALP